MKRTGTNFLSLLLKQNYHADVLINKGGWKHGLYRVKRILGHHVDSVVMVKNPFSWLVSIFRYEKGRHFGHFIKSHDRIIEWNGMTAYWLGMKNKKTPFRLIIIRFEDLFEKPGQTCQRIAKVIGLTPQSHPFTVQMNYIKPSEKITKRKFKVEYYTKGLFMEMFSPDLIQYVNERVDLELTKLLGYEGGKSR